MREYDAGAYNFTGTLTIGATSTVTIASNVGNAQVVIASDDINVLGTITADAKGFAGASVNGAAGSGPTPGGDYSQTLFYYVTANF